MPLNRNRNTWLLLIALTIMVQRILLPFSVPPIIVHDNGYIEICSNVGFTRILLDAEGNRVESQQSASFCPKLLNGQTPLLFDQPVITAGIMPVIRQVSLPDVIYQQLHATLPPLPPRAPPAIT